MHDPTPQTFRLTHGRIYSRIAAISIALLLAGFVGETARAEGFRLLHEFSGLDGERAFHELVEFDGVLYGNARGGGPNCNCGVVFAIDPSGDDFEVLHAFSGPDGRAPFNSFAIYGDLLFGVTREDSLLFNGTVFELDTITGEHTVRHRFQGGTDDGRLPYFAPTAVGDSLYGMTNEGGANDEGVIYRLDIEDGAYAVLHHFAAGTGTRPYGGLTEIGGWLYGTASDVTGREASDPPNTEHGVIFRILLDGSSYEVLHFFAGGVAGGHPYGSLTDDGGSTVYGTTLGEYNNLEDEGVVFRFDVESLEYEVLHAFADEAGDGSKPNGDVVLSPDGETLYGITHGTSVWFDRGAPFFGDTFEYGTLFQLGIDGENFEMLHEFSTAEGGITPERAPVLYNDTLYGATAWGGQFTTEQRPDGLGTLFAYALPEPADGILALAALSTLAVLAKRRARL